MYVCIDVPFSDFFLPETEQINSFPQADHFLRAEVKHFKQIILKFLNRWFRSDIRETNRYASEGTKAAGWLAGWLVDSRRAGGR